MKNNVARDRFGLLDSVRLERHWSGDDQSDDALDLVGSPDSYVLLASGGAGKTTLVDHLMDLEPGSASIDLRLHVPATLHDALVAVTGVASAVYVDAVDEALQTDSEFGYALARFMARPEARRVAWRLTCRPGLWSADLAAALTKALPRFRILELLPLSVADLHDLAGDDAAEFLEAVRGAHLMHMTAQPMNATGLLRQWRDDPNSLTTGLESMRHTVASLLTESGAFRPEPRQSADEMTVVAERLAALVAFCGIDRFVLGGGARPPGAFAASGPAEIAVTAVPTDPEPGPGGARSLGVEQVREVLRTSLFSSAGDGAVRFAHQSFAEFLAASYLHRRRVTGRRLTSLLGADVNGRAPGSMTEVLGWLLALGADVPPALMRDNVRELLTASGLEVADERTRSAAVSAVLSGAAAGVLDEGWRINTAALAHPGLETQLREAAGNPANQWVVFWICRLARHCAVTGVGDELLGLASDPAWPPFIRAEAVGAFAAVAPARRADLNTLLDLPRSEDPENDVLAAVLRAVVPEHLSLEDVASALRPYEGSGYIEAYTSLLRDLPDLLRPEDCLPMLELVTSHLEDETSLDRGFSALVAGLTARAWSQRDDATAARLGRALAGRVVRHGGVFRGHALPWVSDPDDRRRRIAALAVIDLGERAAFAVLRVGLLGPGDLAWLIETYEQADEGRRRAARYTLRTLAGAVADADSADLVLSIGPDSAVYEVLSFFQGVTDLADRPEGYEIRHETPGAPTRAEQVTSLRQALARTREDVLKWPGVAVGLCGDGPAVDAVDVFEPDLTNRALWPDIDQDEQDEILECGLRYLESHHPRPAAWAGLGTFRLSQVVPDQVGAHLLMTLCAHRPDLIQRVGRETWDRWSTTVLQAQDYHYDWHRRIWETAPDVGRDSMRRAMYALIEAREPVEFEQHPIAASGDDRCIGLLETLARDKSADPEQRDAALRVLDGHAEEVGLYVARALVAQDRAPREAIALLGRHAPMDLLAPWLASGGLPPLEYLGDLDVEQLDDPALLGLARVLLTDLPPLDDSSTQTGFTGSHEADARRLRNHLLQVMAVRGMADELDSLTPLIPVADRGWLLHWLQQARTTQARSAWSPIRPDTMMRMLSTGDARLIRDEGGLVSVLLEQLEHIQHDLSRQGLFSGLWDGFPGHNGAAPKSEDHISGFLRNQLQLRLGAEVVVDREIEVARNSAAGSGTRIDITVTARGQRLGRVLIEAKHVHNRSLMKAIDDQLVSRYLDPMGLTHGILLVYWAAPAQRGPGASGAHADIEELKRTLDEQAARHAPHMRISVFLLDIGAPRRGRDRSAPNGYPPRLA